MHSHCMYVHLACDALSAIYAFTLLGARWLDAMGCRCHGVQMPWGADAMA